VENQDRWKREQKIEGFTHKHYNRHQARGKERLDEREED
jgi:hypothetical protein